MQVGRYNGRHAWFSGTSASNHVYKRTYVPLTGAFIIWRHAQPKAIIMHMDQVALALFHDG